MRILVTGAAGFIGFHVSKRLLDRGDAVLGIDNLSDYYDVSLKKARLAQIQEYSAFEFYRLDIAERQAVAQIFNEHSVDRVVNMAAQAGVRYSLKNPHAYVDSNLVGFVNILEGCCHHGVEHLVYASSSSVYGSNKALPSSVADNVDHPISLYAATKRANELMAHTYSHLYGLPTTGLRFFTVYGPWGRPDMALFLFTKAILEDRPIDVYNHGQMRRDFTYIDDVVEGVVRVLGNPPKSCSSRSGQSLNPATSTAPYRLYNIGNHQSVELNRFIELIEEDLGKKARKNLLPMQPGDMQETYADTESLTAAVGFRPNTPIEVGIERFLDWYKDYYGVAREGLA
ncbi:NAD-dependent epimerase [Candidatus Neomarinimicrobiota bacterium]